MNVNPNLAVLSAEPLFFGKDKVPHGVSAEDFVRRIAALAAGNNWTDLQAAGYAVGFLRGDAANWFSRSIRAKDRRLFHRCEVSWLAFRVTFINEWFLVKEAADVHTDWITFRQSPEESFMHFGNRVCAGTTHFTDHLPAIAPEVDGPIAELVGAYRSLATGDEANYDALPADRRLRLQNAVTGVWAEAAQVFTSQVTLALAVRALSNGAKIQKIRDLVRTKERAAEPISNIIDSVAKAEVDLLGTRAGSNTAAVAALNEEELDDAIAALQAKKKKFPPRKHQQPKQAVAAAAPAVATPAVPVAQKAKPAASKDRKAPPAPCKFCGLMHWHRDCPVRQTTVAATNDAPTDSLDYLGNHSRYSAPGNANAGEY